tara:strand:+ start:4587 stop:4856 length:270 start_codon:yes stop_codon:yes gene_type:complete
MADPKGYWAQDAFSVIAGVLKEEHATPEDALAAIDAAYPFGRREYWPYKQWLKMRRVAMVVLGLREQAAPKARAPKVDPRQVDMFGGEG